MGKIKSVMLWLMAVIMLMGCAASRKVEQWSSEQQRDSAVAIVNDSVAKTETKTDSNAVSTTDERHTTGTMTDKGSNEETITERVTESTDAQGNKTTTTDRTVHRKGDYERNATYKARMKHQEETISRMQHTIDSLVLSNKLNVGTHWAKKDSTGVEKEKNTKEIKDISFKDFMWKALKELAFWAFVLLYILGFLSWLKDKTEEWLKSQSSRK
nr:MAG TPA: putative peptidyl-prolyl cis-trans isomerase [Caudoviricetes sp.]